MNRPSLVLLVPLVLCGALLGSASALGLDSGPTATSIPNPSLCTVPNVVYTPGGATNYVVNIQSDEGPIDSAIVQIVFSAEADTLVCWCSGQVHPVITAMTDEFGDAFFQIAAGGCIDPDSLSTSPAVEVFANGLKVAEVGAVSPDIGDGGGKFPWNDWVPGGGCGSGAADAVRHTAPLAQLAYSFCSDINSDLVVSLMDAILLTPSLALGECCN